MKISKQTILIGISTLIVAGGGLTYYLLSKDDPSVLGWMSSSWLYRKSVAVANSGSTLTNEDVLLTIDTAALVTASKLQGDCDDLRFTDSDETTSLIYWVEGGCNTSATQVWVRIPSLTAGGKTIYMYYGNSSATNSEESWSGNFILLSSSSCPTGWTRESTFDAKFPYGSSTYGTSSNGQHNHSQASCTTGGAIGGNRYNSANDDSPDTTATLYNHTHLNATVDISDATIDPSYVGLYFCSNPDLQHFSDSIGIFNTNSSSLPSGFTYYSTLEGRYPKGNNGFIASGGSSTHTHSTVGGYNTNNSTTSGSDDAYNSTTAAVPHYHTSENGTTDSGNNNIPYYTVTYGQVSTNTNPTAGIIEMTSVVPPLGWTYFSSLESKFPLGSSTAGTSYAGATHTHSVSISVGSPNATKQGVWRVTGTWYVLDTAHTHSCTTTSSATQALPPYISTIYSQRKTSQTFTFGSEEVRNTAPNAPSSLQTEGQTNPTGVTDSTPEFTAIFSDTDTSDTGNYYQVQVNTASDFTGTSMWDSTKTAFSPVITNGSRSSDMAYAGSTLQIATTYYWRVKFWDNQTAVNESNWSTTAQFSTNALPTEPTTPYCQGATNPTKVTSATPTFSAIFNDPDTPDTGTYYQILVNTASDFTGTGMWDSTKASITAITNGARSGNITYAGSTLTEGETYYWKIKFWDNNDAAGAWSTVNQFTRQGIPDTPTSLQTNAVANPSALTRVPPYFTAIYSDPNADNAASYQIQVNTNSSFTGTVMWDSGKQSTSIVSGNRSSSYQYNGTAMSNSGDILYWHIKFWDSDDTASEWSAYAQFTDTFSSVYFEGLKLGGLKID